MQDHGETALRIGHTGTMGALAFDAEGALGHGAFGEDGIVVDHQQELRLALPFQRADDILAGGGLGVTHPDIGAKRLEAVGQDGFDLRQAGAIAGPGIDADKLLQCRQEVGPLRFRALQEIVGLLRAGSESRAGTGRAQRDGRYEGC